MSESNSSLTLIQEQYVLAAVKTARKYLEKGADLRKVVKRVAEHYCLEPIEQQQLNERLRKPEPQTQGSVKVDDGLAEDTVRERVIYFETQEQLDEAVSNLMERGIAWSNKSVNEAKPYVQFADDAALSEAQSALRRKYDFVESRQRLVASVQFDNLDDYSKVLEYMRRQGMLIEYQENVDLDEDYDQYVSRIAEEKRLAQKENRPFTEMSGITAFTAKPRTSAPNRVDPVRESRFRMASTRKRWRV
jgi:division protein CdvB (Snf7/Vps24/ESCRT-III family)